MREDNGESGESEERNGERKGIFSIIVSLFNAFNVKSNSERSSLQEKLGMVVELMLDSKQFWKCFLLSKLSLVYGYNKIGGKVLERIKEEVEEEDNLVWLESLLLLNQSESLLLSSFSDYNNKKSLIETVCLLQKCKVGIISSANSNSVLFQNNFLSYRISFLQNCSSLLSLLTQTLPTHQSNQKIIHSVNQQNFLELSCKFLEISQKFSSLKTAFFEIDEKSVSVLELHALLSLLFSSLLSSLFSSPQNNSQVEVREELEEKGQVGERIYSLMRQLEERSEEIGVESVSVTSSSSSSSLSLLYCSYSPLREFCRKVIENFESEFLVKQRGGKEEEVSVESKVNYMKQLILSSFTFPHQIPPHFLVRGNAFQVQLNLQQNFSNTINNNNNSLPNLPPSSSLHSPSLGYVYHLSGVVRQTRKLLSSSKSGRKAKRVEQVHLLIWAPPNSFSSPPSSGNEKKVDISYIKKAISNSFSQHSFHQIVKIPFLFLFTLFLFSYLFFSVDQIQFFFTNGALCQSFQQHFQCSLCT